MVSLPESLTAELRPPAPIVLARQPTGVGKTREVVHAVARHGTRTVYAAPTHELAMQVQADLEALGVSTHYWRKGPTDEDECPHRDMVEFFRGLGYLIRWGPCQHCFKRRRCAYRRLFTSGANKSAQVLIVTSWHLRREDLWTLKAMENRPLVVLDEDALSALAAPVELTVERLHSFIENLGVLRLAIGGTDDPSVAWLTRRLSKPLEGNQALLALTDIFRRAAEDTVTAKPTVRRDGDAIVIDIPMALRHRGGRKEVVLPPGVAPVAESAAGEEAPTALALALARALRWQEMIESGQAESNSDLARKLKLDQSYIARTTRLASLAPDLVEAILDGQEPAGLSLRSLRRDLPLEWDEQGRVLAK